MGASDAFSFVTDDAASFSHVYLLDEAGQKKYLTLQDSKEACIYSRGLNSDTPGIKASTRGQFFAKFPAPPTSATSLQVVFPGGVPTSMPIAKRDTA